MTICKICGNERSNREYKIKEMMFGFRDEFSYILCANCGCLQIKEAPTDMSKYYPKDYYSFMNISDKESKIKRMAKRCRDRYAVLNNGIAGRLIYSFFPNAALKSLSALPLKKDWKILDVGCGVGTLLYSLKELGFENLLGIDPYIESEICYKNRFSILKRTIQDVDGQFNLIMFHHSFEHMEPFGVLSAVARLIAPDGFCIIRIPVADSWAWENYGVNWVQIDAPRHFFLHTRKSMEILANKAGLNIKRVICDSSDFQFWGSEQYKRGIPLYSAHSYSVNPAKSIFSKEQIKLFKQKAEKLNYESRGDQAQFYLQKM
jgi:SAM-dependent methyltransferase